MEECNCNQGRQACTCARQATPLNQANSDGSNADGSNSDRPIVSPPWDSWLWVDEIKNWAAIGVISAMAVVAIFTALGFLAGIVWPR